MELFSDVVMLSRIQFALTIMFHYIYPPMSIGIGVLLVVFEGLYLKTKNPIYYQMTRFFVGIFALIFSLGVASGIVMEFEFGTNWATYSRFVGDVFGSALAAEGIFAFFLESGFLAVLVFGWDKVSPKVHFFSTVMVALGSMFSAVWIVVANSWQQTPTCFEMMGYDELGNSFPLPEDYTYNPMDAEIRPRAEITNFWEMVFNPSSVMRLTHVLLGAWITGAFFVMSICAYYILKNRHLDFAKRGFKIALIFGLLASLAQLAAGHASAHIVNEHQPAKLAAFEGIYETQRNAPLSLFGIPDDEAGEVKYGIQIPGMLSYLIDFDTNYEVKGLNDFPEDERPPTMIPFQMYHIMIACGMFFIGITVLSTILMVHGSLFKHRWLMWIFVFSVFLPHIANQAGWIAAEVGRQPWVVYGLLRTEHGVSQSVAASNVLASLILFTLVYALLFAMFIYLLDKKIRKGPDESMLPPDSKDENLMDAITRRGPGGKRMADGPQGEEK